MEKLSLADQYGFDAAQLAQDMNQLKVYGYADGGIASGLSMVGEEGPELIDFSTPTKVYSNTDTNKLLDNTDILSEIKGLRTENSILLKQNNIYLKKLHTIMRTKQSEDGTAFITETV